MAVRDQEMGAPSATRLVALSDGVVAIAITLLVLQLRVPNISAAEDGSAAALWHAFGRTDFISSVIAYVVSFWLVGIYWMAHHRLFHFIRGHDEPLAIANFVFLLTITVVPFTSELLGRYGNNPLAITAFAANVIAVSLSVRIVEVVARQRGLLDIAATDGTLEASHARSAAVSAIFAVSIAVAWLAPGWASYLWILAAFVPGLAARAVSPRGSGSEQ